jgi:dipeptidyl aminopeptidase/acylaminoacyl peptidase
MSRAFFAAPGLLLALAGSLPAQTQPTIADFLSPASALTLASARHADRIAWTSYERGMRNIYAAGAPNFTPIRLTRFLNDDGVDVTDVSLSDNGLIAVFVRGSAPNRVGWIANPSHDPAGGDRSIWAAKTDGTGAWRVAEGAAPEIAPDGRYVLFVREGQIYRARVQQAGPADSVDRGLKPFIKEWGTQSGPRWSPDGTRIAFVSTRTDHSFIGIYDTRTRRVDFVSPSVDFDGVPTWSPDGKQIAFTRCPGLPFGLQAQTGDGGIGNPRGPAAAAAPQGFGFGGGCVGRFGGGGGGGGGAGRAAGPDTTQSRNNRPGLFRATFPGGYTLSVMVADVSNCTSMQARTTHANGGCGEAHEVWHNAPDDRVFTGINRMFWGSDRLVFPLSPANDEYDRYYSISVTTPGAPVKLTTTDGLIEDATSAMLSADGKTLFYSTNANDIEKRHIWAVPVDGSAAPKLISTDDGIETYPQPLASGKQVAVLYFNAAQPASVGLVPASTGSTKLIFPTLSKQFPVAAHVTPQIVITKAPDGLEIHNQLFLPKDLKPGERRPAMVFVHGGPPRQMLPGYHYMQFYHWAYAINQWLASQGYVVLSINYRLGIGYGRSFRNAQNTNARGNAEYQDVLAGGKYLQTRADVDPTRIGIWGLSYGGLLTSQALARNSDLFIAGADLAGVHLYGSSLDSTNLSYQSSAISAIDTWKSPVFLIQGDDDRNVAFSQMVGLVQLLRSHNIYYELTVIPDDLHESMLHSRWLDTWNRMGDFLKRFVWSHGTAAVGGKSQ